MVWRSNFDETADEYIEDLMDVRPATSSISGTKSNKKLTVNRESTARSKFVENEIKEATFSPSKSKKEEIKKTNEISYSVQ